MRNEEDKSGIVEAADHAEWVRELLERGDYTRIVEDFSHRPPADAAEVVEELDADERKTLLSELPADMFVEVFEYLDLDLQIELIAILDQAHVGAVVNGIAPDNRTALLEALPVSDTRRLLSFLKPRDRRIALALLNYPRESIGRLVTPNYLAVHDSWSVERVLEYIRRNGEEAETLDMIYVVDSSGRLMDDIGIKEFLLSEPNIKVRDLMTGQFHALEAQEDREVAVQAFKKYDATSLPVVDSEGTLIGILTVDDILDVSEQENTEDIHKLGGMESLDEPYMQATVATMVRKRGVWLVALFMGGMFSPTIMGFFEEQISQAVFLALFIPLIIASGGNSGSQAATLVIRAMALGEVRLSAWLEVLWRELLTGLSLGAILGLLGFARVWIGGLLFEDYGRSILLVSLTISITMAGIVLWGTLLGSMLPFILKRLGADPAATSTPFVTTLIDLTGMVIFFNIAVLILGDL